MPIQTQQNQFNHVSHPMKICTILLFSSIFYGHLHAQVTMGRFSAQRYQDKIVLSWDIKAGSFCNGIDIERSTDGIGFTRVGDIAGVCGDPDFDITYQYLDEHPVHNAVNYYRLLLGNQDYSDTVFVQFIQFDSEWKIFPSPASSSSILVLKNPPTGAFILKIWDNNGRIMHELPESYGEQISLSTITLQTGAYHFSIEQNGKRQLTGSFVWED